MTLLAGQRFADRFTVVRLVGEGGMGVVYEVADGRFAGQRRALKTLRPGKESDARSRELFAREATATATIESDHVVKVHDYDLDAAVPWVLMELLSGQSLDERVAEKGPLEWDEARRRVSELGHALGAAHRAGVLHLDLKPANLFLARQNDVEGSTRLKVLDFGLSRVVLEGKTHVLQSRAMGTEAWMPPEQFNKKAELRPSADVWPLGLIAFWMLTARHYWPSVDAQGEVEDAMALMGEVGAGLTASASERARELGVTRGLPAGFDEWFARCLAKNPGERWRDGGEASRALDDVLARASGSMPPRTTTAPTRQHADVGVNAPGGSDERLDARSGIARPPPAPTIAAEAPARRDYAAGSTAGDRSAASTASPAPTAPVQMVLPSLSVPAPVGQTVEWPSTTTKPVEKKPPPWALIGAGVVGVAVVGGLAVKAAGSGGASGRDAGVAPVAAITADASAAPPAPATPVERPPTCPSDTALIPAGSFLMGSPDGEGDSDERPQHRVTLPAFCMERTEVSVAAYRRCTAAGACSEPTTHNPRRGQFNVFCNWGRPGAEDHPVNCVDLNQSKTYCEWAGHAGGARRLPREAEWEYAARGPQNRRYPWGDAAPDGTRTNLCGAECVRYIRQTGITPLGSINGWTDAFGATAPVTSFPTGATPEGLLNMAGNVYEWVEDVHAADAYAHHSAEGIDARANAPGTSQSTEPRVSRGGYWGSRGAEARAAHRFRLAPTDRGMGLGFRCAAGVTRVGLGEREQTVTHVPPLRPPDRRGGMDAGATSRAARRCGERDPESGLLIPCFR